MIQKPKAKVLGFYFKSLMSGNVSSIIVNILDKIPFHLYLKPFNF